MRKKLLLILIPILLWSASAFAKPAPVAIIVDNFETYSNADMMKSLWTPYSGGPIVDLSGVSHAGSKSMQLKYDLTDNSNESWVSFELPEDSDWSEMKTFSIWYQGFEANSADNITIQILGPSNNELFGQNLPGAARHSGWNRWDADLSTAGGDLSQADAVVIGIEGSITELHGTGTVYFDDLSVTNGHQTVWLGTTADWHDPANWSAGVPTATTDARIPSQPKGGTMMPVITAEGAVVHDLVIKAAASLDHTIYDLNITGTMNNRGVTSRTKTLNGNEESFLLIGGHPGVHISPISEPVSTQAVSELGDTSVSIEGGHSCNNAGSSIARCYDIVPDTAAPADIAFYFSAADLGDQVCEDLALYKYTEDTWQLVVGADSADIVHNCDMANFSVVVKGITEYAPFLLSDSIPTAINLNSFTAAASAPLSPIILTFGLLALSALVVLRRR